MCVVVDGVQTRGCWAAGVVGGARCCTAAAVKVASLRTSVTRLGWILRLGLLLLLVGLSPGGVDAAFGTAVRVLLVGLPLLLGVARPRLGNSWSDDKHRSRCGVTAVGTAGTRASAASRSAFSSAVAKSCRDGLLRGEQGLPS